MKYSIVIIIFFSALSCSLFAQNWELSRNENNIKVYKGEIDSSKYKIIKVEAEMQGTLEKVIAILKDVDNNKNWVYNTRRSYLVKAVSEDEFLYYAETHLPWPFDNRDVVIRMHFDLDTARHFLNIKATGEPGAAPEVSGKIRIVYVLQVDPGGNISPAISNLFVTKGPFETFNNLSRLLVK